MDGKGRGNLLRPCCCRNPATHSETGFREVGTGAIPFVLTAPLPYSSLKEKSMKGLVSLAVLGFVLAGATAEATKKAPDKKPRVYTLGIAGAK